MASVAGLQRADSSVKPIRELNMTVAWSNDLNIAQYNTVQYSFNATKSNSTALYSANLRAASF